MISTAAVSHRIAALLVADPPRARSLVATIYGDALAPHGGAAWLGGLIALLGPFGVNERLVRSSVFRLRRDGWLAAERRGRRSRYRLTRQGTRRFALAHRRIYAPPPAAAWSGAWTLLLGTPPPPLRRELEWQGFRRLAPRLYGHPRPDAAALGELLRRRTATQPPALERLRATGLKPRSALWDLAAVAAGYREFLRRFAPLAAAPPAALEPEPAFLLRTLLVHHYRRAVLHDPRLPAAFLPAVGRNWPASAAYGLWSELYGRLRPASERYLRGVLTATR